MATAQLQLIQSEPDWRLDPHTIEVGRAGIAQARAALAGAGGKRASRSDTASGSDNQDQLTFPNIDQAAA